MRKIIFTKQGYDDLFKQQTDLQKQRQPAVDELKRARDLGDLSENGAYRAARSKLSSIDSRIRRLKILITSAKINDRPFSGTVDIGCHVTVLTNNVVQTFQIVGSYESDLANMKISYRSPVGKALMGKKKDEQVCIYTLSGTKIYFIKDVTV